MHHHTGHTRLSGLFYIWILRIHSIQHTDIGGTYLRCLIQVLPITPAQAQMTVDVDEPRQNVPASGINGILQVYTRRHLAHMAHLPDLSLLDPDVAAVYDLTIHGVDHSI